MRPSRMGVRALACLAVAGALLLAPTAGAGAATVTFGSPLSVPATLDTSADLSYPGYGIPTIANGQAIVYHINHDAADTALWNVALGSGSTTAPAGGQITSVSLEGCAEPAPGGSPPLTQIHFQDLAPAPGGAVRAIATSQSFDIPVCGGGVGGGTVTTYQPTELCVHEGDYVGFNDEGGWDPQAPLMYPDGVPYEVLGANGGSTVDAFVANNGTGNGATFSPSTASDRNGFAVTHGEEVLLQATLGTGPDASAHCPGGTRGLATGRGGWSAGVSHAPPTVTLPNQTDGVNSHGLVKLALYCHAAATCTGALAIRLHRGGRSPVLGGASFAVPPQRTGKVTVRLTGAALHVFRGLASALEVQVAVASTGSADQWVEPIRLRGWR